MPRKPIHSSITCEYFNWNMFQRDGVYYADGRSGKYKLGKHSLGTRDRDEAIERLKAIDLHKALELGLAKPEAAKPSESICITAGWQSFMGYCDRGPVMGGVSAGTYKRYRAVRDKHIKFCARQGIADWNCFDNSAIEKYGNWLTKRYADRTVYLELTLLKSVNQWLIENKKLPADARIKCRLSKPQGSDTYCYNRDEVAAMLKHCESNLSLGWLLNVIIALAHLGVRIGELAGLRWSDVDLTNNVITIADERASRRKRLAGTMRTTKGKRSRQIPIHPRLREVLSKMKREPDGRVFHAERGGQIRPRNVLSAFIRDVIDKLKDKFPVPAGENGFEYGRLHSFRHFFVSQCFLGGASEGEIRQWVGHADSKMVEHYRHLGRKEALAKMEQITFVTPTANEQARIGEEYGPAQDS
ncbi:MAG: site-specific integrase [Planctomycetota bacterium]